MMIVVFFCWGCSWSNFRSLACHWCLSTWPFAWIPHVEAMSTSGFVATDTSRHSKRINAHLSSIQLRVTLMEEFGNSVSRKASFAGRSSMAFIALGERTAVHFSSHFGRK